MCQNFISSNYCIHGNINSYMSQIPTGNQVRLFFLVTDVSKSLLITLDLIFHTCASRSRSIQLKLCYHSFSFINLTRFMNMTFLFTITLLRAPVSLYGNIINDLYIKFALVFHILFKYMYSFCLLYMSIRLYSCYK